MAKKKSVVNSRTKKQIKKVAKKLTTKQLIAIIVIAVIIIGAIAIVYFVKPELFGVKKGSSQNTNTVKPNKEVSKDLSFEAHFINVGQGDAILIRFADGTDIMVDAGSSTSGLDSIRTDMLAYLEDIGLDAIDYMIVTHPDTDHYNMAKNVFDAYDVKKIYAYEVNKNKTYTKFLEDAKNEVYSVHGNYDNFIGMDDDGDYYKIDGTGFTIDIHAPGYDRLGNKDATYDAAESNGMSPIVTITAASRKLLLSGDAIVKTEEWFMKEVGGSSYDCDFIKVGHHGSKTSSSEEFLDFVTCEYAIIMVDRDHSHKHPDQIVMDRYNARSMPTYLTEDHGNIVLKVDKEGNFIFEVQKDAPVLNNKDGKPTYMKVAGSN